MEEKFGRDRLYRDAFEAGERATDELLHERPDNARMMAEAPFVHEQFTMRSKVQSKVPMRQNECFADILWKCVEMIEEAEQLSRATQKKPVILLGDQYCPSKGARGGRGFLTKPLVEYLAQFFLIVIVPEHLTSQLCPLCHKKTEFASKDSLRGKVCKGCEVFGGHDFYFDRDFGAPTNFHYKAEFFMRSGGFYPPQYTPKAELEKREKLVLDFLTKLEIATRNQAPKVPMRP